jgi:hypothetical protein
MRHLTLFILTGLVSAFASAPKANTMFDNFDGTTSTQWAYVQDGVMGGVSDGRAWIEEADGRTWVRLKGDVSTANNGGFIQVRGRLGEAWPETATGLKLRVRGNDQRYYVFLRTQNLGRVWYSYRASFIAGAHWSEITLPFTDFQKSHQNMPDTWSPDTVVSIGLVAYGRDHVADLSVESISLF